MISIFTYFVKTLLIVKSFIASQPAQVQGFVTLANNADHLSKLSLIHCLFSKSYWKYFRRLWNQKDHRRRAILTSYTTPQPTQAYRAQCYYGRNLQIFVIS